MTDTTVKKQTLDAFIKQREKRQNDTGIEATKLVNLYRQLPLFGEDFLETYNKMLLDATPEVQMTLTDIVGGSVVRQYLEFLKSKQLHTPDDKQEVSSPDRLIYTTEESYLPSADEIDAFAPTPRAAPVSFEASDLAASQDILKSQTAYFEQSLSKQSELIEKTLNKIQSNIQNKDDNAKSAADEKQALEIQEAQLGAFKTSLQEILQAQNKAWTESVQQIISQTDEMNKKHLKVLESLVAGQSGQKASYPIVEEYAPEGYVAKEYTRPQEPLKPYEFSDIFPEEISSKKENKQVDKTVQVTQDKPLQPQDDKENSNSPKTPKPEKKLKNDTDLDDDVEILSEIDLPSGIL